jgi:hypothetical protein
MRAPHMALALDRVKHEEHRVNLLARRQLSMVVGGGPPTREATKGALGNGSHADNETSNGCRKLKGHDEQASSLTGLLWRRG